VIKRRVFEFRKSFRLHLLLGQRDEWAMTVYDPSHGRKECRSGAKQIYKACLSFGQR